LEQTPIITEASLPIFQNLILFIFLYHLVLNIVYPIGKGIINHWDELNDLLEYIFHGLQVKLYGSSVLMCESLRNSKQKKEKLTQVMFEDFQISSKIHQN
jgi:actin-related protein